MDDKFLLVICAHSRDFGNGVTGVCQETHVLAKKYDNLWLVEPDIIYYHNEGCVMSNYMTDEQKRNYSK